MTAGTTVWTIRNRAGGSLRWTLTACLLATTAVILPAHAAEKDGVQIAQAGAQSFEIPAQPLSSALLRFSRETGIELFFDDSIAQGLRTPGVRGSFTREAALGQLLAGTGLTYRFTNTNTVTLERAANGSSVILSPITVIGEKVERSYLNTYTSVGIATKDDIETYGAGDLHDTFENMANVRHNSGNRGGNGFDIRGLNASGVTQPANSAPLISVIIDGVTQSNEGLKRGARGTWDVEQVEVLRGPQSTTQGRNALAGAVVVKTSDPTWQPEGAVRGIVGTLDRREGAAMVSAPIVQDQVAFRVSGEYREREPDITLADPANKPLNEDEYYNLRGKLLIEPKSMDGLRLLLTGAHAFDRPTSNVVSGPDYFARRFDTDATVTEFREMTVNNFSLDGSYLLNNGLTIRSVTGVNQTDLAIKSAPSSTIFDRDEHREDRDFMQDLRIEASEDIHGFSGVAGLFYGNFDHKVTTYTWANAFGFSGVLQDGIARRQTDTTAAYADLRFRLMERLSLIGGGRYQRDVVKDRTDFTADPPLPPTLFDGEKTFNVFLPKIGLAYELTRTQSVAATASKGYRQGFTEATAGTNTVHSVDPEFMWTYEIAYRFAPSDRLSLGVNVFYNDYSNHQITVDDPVFAPLANTRNVGDSQAYGAEIDGRYDFGNGFKMFGSLGLLKTKFGSFPDDGCAPSGGNCTGNEYPEAPAVTAAIGGSYQHSSGIFAAATATYTDEYFATGDINNQPQYRIDSRFLANARVGYALNSNVAASVFVDNIFDKDYLTGIDSLGSGEAYVGDGRTVGVELRAKF